MVKPRWQRILELEDAARQGSASSNERPLPSQSLSRPDPVTAQMAADVHEIRRKQSIEFYAPGIALIILVAFAFWFFGRP